MGLLVGHKFLNLDTGASMMELDTSFLREFIAMRVKISYMISILRFYS
jgi:hypothetical protein